MGKFEKGQSGNPAGRPQGITDKRSELADLLKPHAPALVEKAVGLALGGDVGALRLCLERLIPKAQNETVSLIINPEDLTKTDLLLNINSMAINAAASGDITPSDGKNIVSMIEAQRKLIEITNISERLTAIEETMNQKKR